MTADGPHRSAARPAAERWFPALLVVTVLLQASTALLRPMLSYRALDIGVGASFLGVVAAAFALAPLLVALRVGRLVDLGHERRFALGGMVCFGLAALVVASNSSLAALLAGSAVMGLGHLATVVATQSLVARASPAELYDRRFAHVAFAASLGQLVGPAVGGFIAGEGTPAGTTMALAAGAAVGLLAVPFTLAMRTRTGKTGVRHGSAGQVPLRSILRAPGMASTMVASVTVLAGVDILLVYLPALGEEVGWSPFTVGLLLAVRAGSSMISRLGLGILADRFGRTNLLIGSLGISAAALAALPLAGALPAAFAIVAVAGLALGLGQPLTVSSVAARAEPGTRATALSVRMMGNRLGQVAVPIAAGLVAGVAGVAGVLVLTGAAVGASTAVVATGTRRDASAARARARARAPDVA